MNSDLQGNTAVLLKPNFVSPTPGSVRDDSIAATVAGDDVQVVGFSVALNESVR